MSHKQFLFFNYIIFSICFAQNIQIADSVVIGINSINKNHENIIIDVFAINNTPIAGVQLDFDGNELFIIDSVSGGRCQDNKFTMYSNEKNRILAFSMEGNTIPKSVSKKVYENSIFKIYGKQKKELVSNDTIRFKSIIAGKKGNKLPSISWPFFWEK